MHHVLRLAFVLSLSWTSAAAQHESTTQLAGTWAAELRSVDPNECRSRIPGFEELGGWLVRNRSATLAEPARVWALDKGPQRGRRSHGAQVWSSIHACAVRDAPDAQYWDVEQPISMRRWLFRRGGVPSITVATLQVHRPKSLPEGHTDWLGRNPARDGLSQDRPEQQRLYIVAAGNTAHRSPSALWDPMVAGAIRHPDRALVILAVGVSYIGRGRYAVPVPPGLGRAPSGSAYCREGRALCLAAPWSAPIGRPEPTGTSFSAALVAAAADAVWTAWPQLAPLDLRNALFECAAGEPRVTREGALTRVTLTYTSGRSVQVETGETAGFGRLSLRCLWGPDGELRNPAHANHAFTPGNTPLSGPLREPDFD